MRERFSPEGHTQFFKGDRLTMEEKAAVNEMRRKVAEDIPERYETPNAEQGGQIATAVMTIGNWQKGHLGFDTSHRVPQLSNFRIFERDQFDAYLKRKGRKIGAPAVHEGGVDTISLQADEQGGFNEEHLYHELVHAMARQSFSLSEDKMKPRHYGIKNSKNRTFEYLNETITQAVALGALAEAKTARGDDPVIESDMAYNDGVIFLDLLFDKLAERSGLPKADIVRSIGQSAFTGDLKPLGMIREYFGTEAMKEIAGLKSVNRPEEVFAKLCACCGIDQEEYVNRYKAYEKGDGATVLDGVVIRSRYAKRAVAQPVEAGLANDLSDNGVVLIGTGDTGMAEDDKKEVILEPEAKNLNTRKGLFGRVKTLFRLE